MSGKVVEVVGSSTADGATVDQHTWSSGQNQEFLLESLGSARMATPEAIVSPGTKKEMLSFQNPIQGAGVINLSLDKDGPTNLTLFDMQGRPVSVLLNTQLQKGDYSVPFARKGLAAGVYILTLSQNDNRVSRRLVTL